MDSAHDNSAMDDDPVLRSLGADLERDDPELAALLSGTVGALPQPASPRDHTGLWFLLVPLLLFPVLTAALLLPARVTLGVTAMLLILGSPLAVCWMCAAIDRADPGAPRHP
jgi:hypothetical protein